MNHGKTECTFLWRIENYSNCWHKNGEELVSPKFTADGFEGTVWTLDLYPRGRTQEHKDYISLFLSRYEVDDGPIDFSVKYELSILVEKGMPVSGNFEYSLVKGWGRGRPKFLRREEALVLRKADFLPQDTLRVRCRMWKGEGNVREATEITARTRIGIQEISYLHLTENFNKLQPNEKKNIEITSPSNKQWNLTLYFIEDSSGGKIMLEITPSDKNHILAKCKISLLDRFGKKIECGEADNRLDDTRRNIRTMTLSLTRKAILDAESDYLSQDNLSLQCECIFSTGVELDKIEKTVYERSFAALSEVSDNQDKGVNNASQKLSACPSAVDHLKAIFNDQLHTDVELKTATKSFPAHKVWLCARSPVFQTMLSSDMKEKNTNIIPIDDLEDDTLQQFLAFLYTDEVEDLCWESAIKLYYAADKYQVEKLKVICASFLVDNASATSASELLVLADTHSDSNLKEAVENFILRRDQEVFASEEWEKLSEVNPRLANKTMLLKYKRK